MQQRFDISGNFRGMYLQGGVMYTAMMAYLFKEQGLKQACDIGENQESAQSFMGIDILKILLENVKPIQEKTPDLENPYRVEEPQ